MVADIFPEEEKEKENPFSLTGVRFGAAPKRPSQPLFDASKANPAQLEIYAKKAVEKAREVGQSLSVDQAKDLFKWGKTELPSVGGPIFVQGDYVGNGIKTTAAWQFDLESSMFDYKKTQDTLAAETAADERAGITRINLSARDLSGSGWDEFMPNGELGPSGAAQDWNTNNRKTMSDRHLELFGFRPSGTDLDIWSRGGTIDGYVVPSTTGRQVSVAEEQSELQETALWLDNAIAVAGVTGYYDDPNTEEDDEIQLVTLQRWQMYINEADTTGIYRGGPENQPTLAKMSFLDQQKQLFGYVDKGRAVTVPAGWGVDDAGKPIWIAEHEEVKDVRVYGTHEMDYILQNDRNQFERMSHEGYWITNPSTGLPIRIRGYNENVDLAWDRSEMARVGYEEAAWELNEDGTYKRDTAGNKIHAKDEDTGKLLYRRVEGTQSAATRLEESRLALEAQGMEEADARYWAGVAEERRRTEGVFKIQAMNLGDLGLDYDYFRGVVDLSKYGLSEATLKTFVGDEGAFNSDTFTTYMLNDPDLRKRIAGDLLAQEGNELVRRLGAALGGEREPTLMDIEGLLMGSTVARLDANGDPSTAFVPGTNQIPYMAMTGFHSVGEDGTMTWVRGANDQSEFMADLSWLRSQQDRYGYEREFYTYNADGSITRDKDGNAITVRLHVQGTLQAEEDLIGLNFVNQVRAAQGGKVWVDVYDENGIQQFEDAEKKIPKKKELTIVGTNEFQREMTTLQANLNMAADKVRREGGKIYVPKTDAAGNIVYKDGEPEYTEITSVGSQGFESDERALDRAHSVFMLSEQAHVNDVARNGGTLLLRKRNADNSLAEDVNGDWIFEAVTLTGDANTDAALQIRLTDRRAYLDAIAQQGGPMTTFVYDANNNPIPDENDPTGYKTTTIQVRGSLNYAAEDSQADRELREEQFDAQQNAAFLSALTDPISSILSPVVASAIMDHFQLGRFSPDRWISDSEFVAAGVKPDDIPKVRNAMETSRTAAGATKPLVPPAASPNPISWDFGMGDGDIMTAQGIDTNIAIRYDTTVDSGGTLGTAEFDYNYQVIDRETGEVLHEGITSQEGAEQIANSIINGERIYEDVGERLWNDVGNPVAMAQLAISAWRGWGSGAPGTPASEHWKGVLTTAIPTILQTNWGVEGSQSIGLGPHVAAAYMTAKVARGAYANMSGETKKYWSKKGFAPTDYDIENMSGDYFPPEAYGGGDPNTSERSGGWRNADCWIDYATQEVNWYSVSTRQTMMTESLEEFTSRTGFSVIPWEELIPLPGGVDPKEGARLRKESLDGIANVLELHFEPQRIIFQPDGKLLITNGKTNGSPGAGDMYHDQWKLFDFDDMGTVQRYFGETG